MRVRHFTLACPAPVCLYNARGVCVLYCFVTEINTEQKKMKKLPGGHNIRSHNSHIHNFLNVIRFVRFKNQFVTGLRAHTTIERVYNE